MKQGLFNKTLGLAVAAGLALTLVAAEREAAAQDKRFAGVTLRVATYGGAWRDSVRDFVGNEIEKLGGKVEYVIGSPQDNLAKLLVARGRDVPFDVYEMSASIVPEALGAKVLAPIDLKNIPNIKYLDKHQYNDMMVASWITQESIVYNVEKFKELGIPKPERLQDLKNPKLAGKVSIPDISSGGGIEGVAAFAFAAGGNEDNIEPGLKLIKEINTLRFWKAGGEVVTQLKSGDVWAAVIHAGWGVRAVYAGVPAANSHPIYGTKRGMIKEGFIGVVRNTKHQAAAEFFLNAYLAEEAQYQMSLNNGTIAVNRETQKRLGTTPVVKDFLMLEPEQLKNMARLDFEKVNLSKWNELWSRTVTR
ncbi:MAG: ABC transporter substrate-binding protein [Pseudomonadota bacterium]